MPADSQNYTLCDSSAELGSTGLTYGTTAGTVEVSAATATSFTVTAHSQSGNTFTISRTSSGAGYTRTCSTAADGGCPSSGAW